MLLKTLQFTQQWGQLSLKSSGVLLIKQIKRELDISFIYIHAVRTEFEPNLTGFEKLWTT